MGFKEEFIRFCKRVGGRVRENSEALSCINIHAPLDEVGAEYKDMLDRSGKEVIEGFDRSIIVEGIDAETGAPFMFDLDVPNGRVRIKVGNIININTKLPKKFED